MLETLSARSPSRLAIKLHPRAERAVKRGHPWVFAHGIKQQRQEGRPGDLAVLFDRHNRFLAIGLYDPGSPLRVRVLHRGSPETIDRAWFAGRIRTADERRACLRTEGTTGYRVVHGENDSMPGLVVDRYGDTIVVKLYSAAWIPHLSDVLESLRELLSPERVVLRLSRAIQQEARALADLADGQLLQGTTSTRVRFRENGLDLEVDPVSGQKTGFFLDQRDNRARLERFCAGKAVLNVFAYTGGFSLYAARGGAREVTSLDISRPALATAERNFSHNRGHARVAAAVHHLLQGDAFDLLQVLGRRFARYDVVVLDPPSFAKAQGEVEAALRSYRRLIRLGLGVLAPGGLLVAASCSSRIGADAFAEAVGGAAREAGRSLEVICQTGHPIDHPISFPEAAYLKCIFARSEG